MKFQAALSRIFQSRRQEAHPQQQVVESTDMDKPATLMLAEKVSRAVLHRDIRPDKEKRAEPLVHYAYGIGGAGFTVH
jgi:hypothetical protein